jgi:Tfp pilus assembly protein PilO
MKGANRTIVAVLILAALAIGFWVLLLAPKREEATKLSEQVEQKQAALAEARYRLTEAEAARREFPDDYRQLVVLGKAVPGSDDTSSLLVELNKIARDAKVSFNSIQLTSTAGGEAGATEATAPAVAPGATVPPTEAAAALLPLGATVGPAGLGVMPYNLSFGGSFFQIADFINGVDSLVKTGKGITVDGRLTTVDGFALVPQEEEGGSSSLEASFIVTTYVTPPDQGITAGATPAAPASEAAVPAAESGEPAPSSTPVSEAQ